MVAKIGATTRGLMRQRVAHDARVRQAVCLPGHEQNAACCKNAQEKCEEIHGDAVLVDAVHTVAQRGEARQKPNDMQCFHRPTDDYESPVIFAPRAFRSGCVCIVACRPCIDGHPIPDGEQD
eukprot:3936626-Rhodomonas_salina.6